MAKNNDVKSCNVKYISLELNNERTEMLAQKGTEFSNDRLLESLGFKQDDSYLMKISAMDNFIDIDKGNKKIKRMDNKGNILSTALVDADKIERLEERAKALNQKLTQRRKTSSGKDELKDKNENIK